MEAPWKDQLALLDLQELDSKIAKLQFRLKKMPQLAQLAELKEKDRILDTKKTKLSALQADKKREITGLENDLAAIENRQKIQQERLDNGQGSPKELVNLQEEIQQMKNRSHDLEEQMLTVMDGMEQLESIEEEIAQRKAEYAREITRLEGEVGAENSQISAQLEQLVSERAQKAAGLDADLLDLYEHIRERTGGVGAVKVVAGRPVGYDLSFSVAETAHLRAAKPEEVITSEDEGYLLIRCPQ
ncbi:zinc ribbon domain-containing protein [Varibaculum prostatecancerukia]|uniref:zinc ribbon domain-containing protein n=1 Tax=Varibaculum prostatecancerukia TaxID=2811781 RepID=UPI001C0074AF|nr:hypothetical protein [Varibaculum prostatecancerukia]